MPYEKAAPAALTLAVGALGGAVFDALGFPAGWLAGSACATAIAALAGYRLSVPSGLRFPTLIVMGMAMGSAITPATLQQMGQWPLSLALMLASVFTSFFIGTVYLRRVHGWDRATARLCATPGALTTVLTIALETRARVPVVALSHALRQFFLMCLVPLSFALQPMEGAAGPLAGPRDFLIILGAALAAALVCRWLRLPTALLIGAMLGSTAVHASGLAVGAPPPLLQSVSFVVLGAITGSAFSGYQGEVLRASLLPSIGCILVSTLVALLFALAAFLISGIPAPQLFIAFAPGGVEGMNALAVAMNLDPAFVGVHHTVRLLALMLLSPLWAAAILVPAPAEGGAPPSQP